MPGKAVKLETASEQDEESITARNPLRVFYKGEAYGPGQRKSLDDYVAKIITLDDDQILDVVTRLRHHEANPQLNKSWRHAIGILIALIEENTPSDLELLETSEIVAPDFTNGEKVLRVAVLGDEILSAINTLGSLLPEAGRPQFIEKTMRNAAEALCTPSAPRQGQATAQAADEALAKVKGDATLLRQWHVYQRLLTTVVLPADKEVFKTLEEAANATNLAKTYFRARARQVTLGVELVPENDKYIKQVASTATLSYQKLKPKSDALVA